MSLAQFFVVLKARWLALLGAIAAVLFIGILATLLMPKQYTAVAAVLVENKAIEPVTGAVLPPPQGSGFMATQMDLVQSERVVLRAAQTLKLLDAPEFQFRSRWLKATGGQGNPESWMLEQLGKKLEVRPTRESGVMTLSFTAESSDASARVVNAIVQSYIDTTLDLRLEHARSYNNLFDVRAREARAELEAAQSKLAFYQREKGMVVTDERMDLESSRLAELSTQLVALQGVTAESGSRQRQADNNPERMTEVLNSPVVSSLAQELSRQQARLSELAARLGPAHPQMVEARANVDQLRTQIARESAKVTGSVSVNNSVNQTRLAQLRASIDEQRARLLALRSARDEASVLLRDVQSAQRAYDAVLARASQSALETQNREPDISVLKRATPPGVPASPKTGLNLAISLILGTIAGLCFVLMRELKDRRLRTAEDVEELLGLNLLVEMPKGSKSGSASGSRASKPPGGNPLLTAPGTNRRVPARHLA